VNSGQRVVTQWLETGQHADWRKHVKSKMLAARVQAAAPMEYALGIYGRTGRYKGRNGV
jgi:hypothetical protein